MIINGKIDMHVHTSASDGTWAPKEVMEKSQEANIGLIAITDHDEIINLEECKTEALKKGILYLNGAEISTTYKGESFHVLAYGLENIENTKLMDIIENNRYLLEKKDDDFIKSLINRGYNISFEDYLNYEHKSSKGGWKGLSFLIDAGLCSDVGDFFKNLFIKENEGIFPNFPETSEVIAVIKELGAVPVLAHPYYYPSSVDVEERLKLFYEMGIQGFECYHPNHNKVITEACLNWCKKNNTIITAGSDCHGEFIVTRHLGHPEVYNEDINLGIIEEYIIC